MTDGQDLPPGLAEGAPAAEQQAKRVGSYSVSRATRSGQRSAICMATAPP
jgi:hypothetical protein